MKTEQFQGLKLLFVLSIVFMHAGMPILGEGADLCSFFFVISGFFYKGETCVRYRDYMWNKISSMLPLQWMSVILAVVVLHLSVHWDIIPHLLLLQSYIPEKGFEFFNYNGVAWFLSSLMFCYALSPVVYKVILKIKDKKLLWLLNEIDQFIKHKLHIKYYCRYLDDSIVIVKTKQEAKDALIKIQKFLKENLELELNKKTQIFKNKQGVNFCGYKINEYRLKIRDKGKRKLKKKVKKLKEQIKLGKITSKEAHKYLAGHMGYIKYANTRNLENKLFYLESEQ